MQLKKGDPCRVRLHTGEVVDAVYDEPGAIYKDHWVHVNQRLCRATNYLSDEVVPRVRFVGNPCDLVPVGVSV